MSTPLNPLLYEQLQKVFKHVRVSSPGVATRFQYRPDWQYRQGRPRANVVDWGESYYVSCPFCSDTRGRLSVNHRWGVRDERTGDDMLHLVTCFNESCLANRESQKELHALVYPRGEYGRQMQVRIKPSKAKAPPEPVRIQLPPGVPLTELPKAHPGLKYLRKRGFDPASLTEIWRVRFCEENRETYPQFADPRLVIPIYTPKPRLGEQSNRRKRLRLAGWQARLIRSQPHTESTRKVPKYLTARGMRRNDLLYGLPQALKADGPVVLVEGVTDVWRLGPGAVALFGKTISTAQCRLLQRHFADRPVVILLDADAQQEAAEIQKRLSSGQRAAGGSTAVVVGRVPAHRNDPGDCTPEEVREAVENALHKSDTKSRSKKARSEK